MMVAQRKDEMEMLFYVVALSIVVACLLVVKHVGEDANVDVHCL